MDLIDQLRLLSSRIAATKDMIQTEEATKNAMIMPFIQLLGYNVFDPMEVTPELIADIGIKKGEKVDYAILRDGKPIMLFECKKSGAELQIQHAGQLFRYFHVTETRFGVLTNGLIYKFFTDLEQPNKMDETPFFEFNILEFKERDVEELKKFAKSAFDVDTILATANDLKSRFNRRYLPVRRSIEGNRGFLLRGNFRRSPASTTSYHLRHSGRTAAWS